MYTAPSNGELPTTTHARASRLFEVLIFAALLISPKLALAQPVFTQLVPECAGRLEARLLSTHRSAKEFL
jgi:hypothetical protein